MKPNPFRYFTLRKSAVAENASRQLGDLYRESRRWTGERGRSGSNPVKSTDRGRVKRDE